jgi:hypothetical protein
VQRTKYWPRAITLPTTASISLVARQRLFLRATTELIARRQRDFCGSEHRYQARLSALVSRALTLSFHKSLAISRASMPMSCHQAASLPLW